MLDAYTSVGMPIYYKHWSYGKEFVFSEKSYKAGKIGLAYEMVINSDPCIAYLMEENNANLQTMVMAHANIGHSAVFKNNYLFKQHTDASSIVDYLNFAKNYIKKCEEKYGMEEVEHILDSCHSLLIYGVDKYKKPRILSPLQEEKRALERFERELDDYDPIWEKVGRKKKIPDLKEHEEFEIDPFPEPFENILYFIEKNAPHLQGWKREIIRIVRNLSEYFSPQRVTKVLNEGWASFCHYFIMHRLYEKELIDAGSMLEFYSMHAGVLSQHKFSSFNPYKLGFSIFMDIKRLAEGGHWIVNDQQRIWEEITDEDRKYFPNLINTDWVETTRYAMENYKDETFILQYLSPKVARDLQMFAFNDPEASAEEYTVTDISNERGFRALRTKLANNYALENQIPDIQVTAVDYKGTRKLIIEHIVKNEKPLHIEDAKKVLQHVADLWEYSAVLKTFEYNEEGEAVPLNLIAFGKFSTKKKEEH
jgi:stage V sporulation protein R